MSSTNPKYPAGTLAKLPRTYAIRYVTKTTMAIMTIVFERIGFKITPIGALSFCTGLLTLDKTSSDRELNLEVCP